MRWKCAGNALEMRWKCAGNALEMRWKCAGDALEMRWKCAGNALKMRSSHIISRMLPAFIADLSTRVRGVRWTQSRLNPWRGLSGLPREIWLLFVTTLINRAGMMVLPFLVIYLTRELRFSAARAGFVFAVYGATAALAGPMSGKLSDRIGALPIMRASLGGAVDL